MNDKKRKETILVVLFALSLILFVVFVPKYISVDNSDNNLSLDGLTSELGKYNCSIIDKNEDKLMRKYYITDTNCIFNIEYREFLVQDKDYYYKEYLDKVNDNGLSIKTNQMSINKKIVSKETEGDFYKFMSVKNNSILYMNTSVNNKEEAKLIREHLGYKYTFNFKYLIVPCMLFVISIIGMIYVGRSEKKLKRKGK